MNYFSILVFFDSGFVVFNLTALLPDTYMPIISFVPGKLLLKSCSNSIQELNIFRPSPNVNNAASYVAKKTFRILANSNAF